MKLAASFLLCLFVVTAITSLFPRAVTAQNLALESIDVFLDCERRSCDFDYIRREIPYVNYVRDRTEALVHILVTTERTGSGGRAYKLNFVGMKDFSALSDTLRYTSSGTDTDDERRTGLVRKIAEGLVRYISRTSIADRMVITVTRVSEDELLTSNPPDDPWDSWNFGVGLNGEYEAEETSNNANIRGRLSANRTTEEWKLIFSLGINYRERNFDVGDQTITSITKSGNFWTYVVKSIAPQWSVGVSSFTDTSTRQNRKLSSSLAPAIEYSLFPYSESNQRQITFVYELRFQTVEYEELTVFDKTHEKLLSQSLKLNLDYRQPWGSASAQLEGSNFITDFESSRTEFYSVEVSGSISVRLVRGLNVNLGFGYDLVKDQLFLVKEELTEEEILLGTKRLPTSYEYEFRMGFSYNFGSIYNNVVNSRMNVRF
ncbi:MAG: hypothetical protein BMS9Abin05_0153 [Rhodothermia bacterium]|nr:MAG: hypothetical protein BMS9Abin05_0153 [Rhodothermia bacterium]